MLELRLKLVSPDVLPEQQETPKAEQPKETPKLFNAETFWLNRRSADLVFRSESADISQNKK